ncbi:hypothetical protein BKA65DRAFT_568643 [Rhexocercosporidium sp. MPI-PUGE-AT-0058]|nr:hypothetical protein BKA65DRAFT_568643 [Rhexocercosporidium sp. MPI-PUGE-AT-0058]
MTEPHPNFWKRSVGRFGKSKADSSASGSASASGSGGATTTFRFVEGEGTSKSTEGRGEDSDLTPKQRRRAQVRKAQIEHRQRKENLVKYLEQEVIDLREQIAQAETQAVLFKHENISIKAALQNGFVQIPAHLQTTTSPTITRTEVPRSHYQSQSPEQGQGQLPNASSDIDTNMDLTSPDDVFNLTSPSSIGWLTNNTLVRTTFDPFLDEECLQISPAGSFPLSIDSTSSIGNSDFGGIDTNAVSLPSPDMFNSASWKPAVLAQQEREKAQLQQREQQQQQGGRGADTGQGPAARKLSYEEEMEMLAINFILALEHPCRTHFSPPSTGPYDPTSNATGHELMATTHLFSHASSFTKPNPPPHSHPPHSTHRLHPSHTNKTPSQTHRHDPALAPVPAPSLQTGNSSEANINHAIDSLPPGSTWRVPPLDLKNLFQMSESMPKENWEITPVQAWFLLVGRYGWERLLGIGRGSGGNFRGGRGGGEKVMDSLKKGLTKLVSCLGFGSVIDEAGFWEVVGSVLGEDGGSEWV